MIVMELSKDGLNIYIYIQLNNVYSFVYYYTYIYFTITEKDLLKNY